MSPIASSSLSDSVSVLFVGPTGTGTTYPMFQLPGPLLLHDAGNGAHAYRRRMTFDLEHYDSFGELIEHLERLLADPVLLARYRTIGLDDLTVAWQAAVRGVEDRNRRVPFSRQAELKDPAKRLAHCIMRLGKRGLNVVASAKIKATWDTTTNPREPRRTGIASDLDQRVWDAFELVILLEAGTSLRGAPCRMARVLKSRHDGVLALGRTIEDFDAAIHLAPLFPSVTLGVHAPETAAGAPTAADPAIALSPPVDPASLARDQAHIKAVLRRLRARSRGGVVDDAECRTLWGVANGEASPDAIRTAVARARALDTAHPAAS